MTVDDDGTLYAISENRKKIVAMDPDGNVRGASKLEDMRGYDAVAHYFDRRKDNKGLEGITSRGHRLFVLKEREPGLLIEVSKDLTTISGHKRLSRENGFHDSDLYSL